MNPQQLETSSASFWIATEDWHTAGEPFRIVEKLPGGFLPNAPTVAQKRLEIIHTPSHPLDQLRRSLCHEPRGHADMYGGFITPPDDSGAHFGVLFWHKDGFSTACGHGTIALGYWALTRGLIQLPQDDGIVDAVVDVPSGRVICKLFIKSGKIVHANFINVASFQFAAPLSITVESLKTTVSLNLSFAGAVYASLDASQLGLKVQPNNVDQFIALGREIKASLGRTAQYGPYDCYGVIFSDEEGDDSGVVRQRNVTVFADGQIDRSPCGSGTCARLAVLLAEGRIKPSGSRLQHRSIIESAFEADIVEEVVSPVPGFPACIPRVKGQANLVGRMNFYIDPAETTYPGFLLR